MQERNSFYLHDGGDALGSVGSMEGGASVHGACAQHAARNDGSAARPRTVELHLAPRASAGHGRCGGLVYAGSGTTLHAFEAPPESSVTPIAVSSAMRRLHEQLARAARTNLPVLVLGETGSGKELVARAMHDKSPRAAALFNVVNCAAIPPQLIASTLFGYERGAFTGADRQVQGLFEQAHGGTVFLDEVGELAPPAQAALLRVLEQRRILRVGGTREIEVNVRIVAATHRDLTAMVQSGTFREDLLFRLDAISLHVPPLRERREEIIPLAELFLARAREQWPVLATRLSGEVCRVLSAYRWPGNVRELRNVINRAATLCTSEVVELDDLPEALRTDALPAGGTRARQEPCRSLSGQVREFEMMLIRDVLEKVGGNQTQAAKILGVPRKTLAGKIQGYGLARQRASDS